MKFYGRQTELRRLGEIAQTARTGGRLTMVTGRRRIGKTTLVKHFLQQRHLPHCYFFVSRKQPHALLDEFAGLLAEQFPEIAGLRFEDFEGFCKFIFQKLRSGNFTVVLDEFQNFHHVDPAFFSVLQKYWDEHHDKINGQIIVIGSIQTLMHTIFENRKEPLFKRLNGKILLAPFGFQEMRSWLSAAAHGDRRLGLELYLLFGGAPFYYYLLQKEGLYGQDLPAVLERLALQPDSLLFNEGKELTIEELGANYGRYFSILEAIAGGHTQWNNIAMHSGVPANSLGKYLEELHNYYNLIEKKTSLFSRENGKASRYYLRDPFLAFWFRYVYKNASVLAEFSSRRFLPKLKNDLPNFFGGQFERFIAAWLQRQGETAPQEFPFEAVGKYWDKGENEIDVVAYRDDGEACLVGECKWNSKRIDLAVVEQLNRAIEVIKKKRHFKKFSRAVFVGDEMPEKLKARLREQEVQVFDLTDYWSDE